MENETATSESTTADTPDVPAKPDTPVDAGAGSNEATDSPAASDTATDAPHTGTGTDGNASTEEVAPSNPPTDSVVVDPSASPDPDDFQYVFPIEWRQHSAFTTGEGMINVVHEITLGDLLISTLLLVLIIWQVISRLVRR